MDSSNMWQNSCKSGEPTCEMRQMMRGYEEERLEKCKPAPPKPKCPDGCNYVYDVSYVQFMGRERERYIALVKDIDRHMKKHHREMYAGLQLYQTGRNTYVVVSRYYDKPDCREQLPHMIEYVNKRYYTTFGRGIRRTQILNFKEAVRLFC